MRSILDAGTFRVSKNRWDWLGEGVYFWEYAPYRALDWAREQLTQPEDIPAVLGVTIRLGVCLNLLDTEPAKRLHSLYGIFSDSIGEEKMPKNTPNGAHFLDSAIVDNHCRIAAEYTGVHFQTVRGCFPEGDPVYPGSKILKKAHVQIAVRDQDCISRLHLVEFSKAKYPEGNTEGGIRNEP